MKKSFVTGAIALVFLAIGYQTAVFIHRASVMKILADRTSPDTVYVLGHEAEFLNGISGYEGMDCLAHQDNSFEVHPDNESRHPEKIPGTVNTDKTPGSGSPDESRINSTVHADSRMPRGRNGLTSVRRSGRTTPQAAMVVSALTPRTYESFRFNPNTASVEELCRLGFTLKQAKSIDNYRKKGGRFRRKSDFARSFVVSDTVYKRLAPYIDIPLLDINKADSSDFDALPGIGGYFASMMVEYRERLGGYSSKSQLLEIYRMDKEKYSLFEDLVEVGEQPVPFGLWSLPADSLRKHPHVRSWRVAKAIVLYRDNNPRTAWTIHGLLDAGIIDNETASRLSLCNIAEP